MGEFAVVAHVATKKHKEAERVYNKCQPMASFVSTTTKKEELRISAAELSMALYLAKHNNSFNSAMCSSKLIPLLFSDSNTARGFSSSKTKSAALIMSTYTLYLHYKLGIKLVIQM